MRSGRQKVHGIAWIGIVILFTAFMFAASFFITSYLFRLTNIHLPAVVIQVINSMLGLFLCGLVAGAAGKFSRKKGWMPEMSVFAPVLDALEKIAKGDFSIRLESTHPDNQMVNVLTKSVNKMALELEQMENLRQEFISNVSHEIQSPLTSIRGFAQALHNESLSPVERQHYLSIIETESTRLSRITEGLLRLAALDSEHVKVDSHPYRLDKQIRALILACEPQWTAKDLEMNVSMDPVEINADEDLLSQVWTNLIHNSIKFSAQGGQVDIHLRCVADSIEFRIHDAGMGIAPEDQGRVFERFYKADPSRTNSNGGSGLGLAIAKKIVEMHHGEIHLDSASGAGTTFTVHLSATHT